MGMVGLVGESDRLTNSTLLGVIGSSLLFSEYLIAAV